MKGNDLQSEKAGIRDVVRHSRSLLFKAAGDKLLMNKFIRKILVEVLR